ncbi:hypothetical protein FNW02_12735 [Komarekiella sp. 'clone 1']|uniref:Uncharacterized protein n=1 Tax=Komarekiella delphini-convector SJRDD-AB1 TaxID=2593771 RepID=A0AA40SX54_9NOST|nr:hypothetical protein [Komarekiella delphini-convector]MBD6616674.1 hypothetical protein [Komarekiella delphini-convector SJRDD-AB1]
MRFILMAIAINLIIATIHWLIWISLTSASMFGVPILDKMKALLAVALSISLMMIYATLAQLILLLKTPKRSFWVISTIGTAIFLPPIILEFLGVSSWKNPNLWIFSTFP